MIKRYKYTIKGQVQGVGFRPFVYKMALSLGLTGFIKNTKSGVEIEVEAVEKSIVEFERVFFESLPPLARVDEFSKKRLAPLYSERFEIVKSLEDQGRKDLEMTRLFGVEKSL